MKLLTHFWLRARWLNLPGALLIALLQRTPVLRVVTLAEEAVVASPFGQLLRAAAATVASLGALHTLAGATQFVVNPNPVNGTVGSSLSVAFSVVGAPTPAGSYKVVGGSFPPGINFAGVNSSGVLNVTNPSGAGTITGTPTAAGTFTVRLMAYEFANAQGDQFPDPPSTGFAVTFLITSSTGTAPAFSAQPQSQTVTAGANVTFTVTATGSPAPTIKWRKDGNDIAGATGTTLTLTSVQVSDGGAYTAVATNSVNTVTSNPANLIVNPTTTTGAPAITAQPAAKSVAVGATAVFTVAATGTPTPVFQWSKNNTPITNATSATLVVTSASAADAGLYSVAVTNSVGSAASVAAELKVIATTDVGRLINLSILTALTANETMTMGAALGGAGTSGTKPLLARAAGPALAQLGVSAFLPDPTMTLNSTSTSPATVVATNNDWAGDPALSAAFNAVGAFAYPSATSKDAAIFRSGATALAAGNYTVQVRDAGSGVGTMIAELYDATPNGSFTPSTPRLINVSVLKNISATGSLTAGFFVGGSTAKTVLIRAIGPGLASVGVTSGTLADPQLTLFNSSQVQIAVNNDWGGDQQLTNAGTRVGAFAVNNPNSKDAMLLVTLDSGTSYTVQMSPISGTAGGLAIIEVYEVP